MNGSLGRRVCASLPGTRNASRLPPNLRNTANSAHTYLNLSCPSRRDFESSAKLSPTTTSTFSPRLGSNISYTLTVRTAFPAERSKRSGYARIFSKAFSLDSKALGHSKLSNYPRLHHRSRRRSDLENELRSVLLGSRYKSSSPFGPKVDVSHTNIEPGKPTLQDPPRIPERPMPHQGATSSMTNKHLMDRLPHIPNIHRPSKEELLAAATGFWSRLKVRFKWFSIRSARPFNADDIGAFFSWVLVGHVLWIILGTTTFFSLAIFAVNTVFAQETLARWVGNYLTKSSGAKVIFESAIVPKWGDGVISFKNVFVSRRPGQGNGRVSKGSQSTAAAAAAAASLSDNPREFGGVPVPRVSANKEETEDTNYTQFDLSIDTVNVTLSFTKWFNSKGLLRDVEVKGVRGVIDRTNVHYTGEYVDPRTYKHEHNPGDFEINSFKMEDLLVNVHQPRNFRPFSVSIFTCELPQLRRQWLFYDFLSANVMSGSFDESLFTIHPRQMHGYTGTQHSHGIEANGKADPWKKHSRLRIDGLNIDHLNRGVEGPFSWIHKGNVDIVADIMFPADNDESIAKVMSDFYDRMEATVISNGNSQGNGNSTTINNDNVNEDTTLRTPPRPSSDDDKRFLVMDLRVHLNDVRATVPLFTKDLSYVNSALIRPIVAYINSRKTFIPIHCRVVKRVGEFDGSWTIFDSGLMDDLSAEVRSPLIYRMQFSHMTSDLSGFRQRRHGRPGTVTAFQEGWIMVSATCYPSPLHGHGWKYCMI